MADASNAMVILQRELALAHIGHLSVVWRFRRQEAKGVNPPAKGHPPYRCGVLLGIKINPRPYAQALKNQTDYSFNATIRHAAILLLAGHAGKALTLAKAAYAATDNAQRINIATDMIARCFKAQDGTIGRANAFIAAMQGPAAGAAGGSGPVDGTAKK